jgi:hypothetical protein
MSAIKHRRPPHRGQASTSKSNVRRIRSAQRWPHARRRAVSGVSASRACAVGASVNPAAPARPRGHHHRLRGCHRHQGEGHATRRAHPPDGHGTARSVGDRHRLRLPRVSSVLRRLSRHLTAAMRFGDPRPPRALPTFSACPQGCR